MKQDTLHIDTLQIQQWQSDVHFDYDREVMGGGESLWSWLSRKFWEYVDKIFGDVLDTVQGRWLLIIVGALAVGFVVWLLWKYKPGLFGRSGKLSPLDYEVTEDTIYGIDFDAEIAKAEAQGNYREAVRLVYLHTLAQLSDAHKLDWQPQKTPTQYMREVSQPAFAALSRHFIRVRYGNFEATSQLLDEMRQLQQGIAKGGEP